MGDHPTAFAELHGALERAIRPPIEVAVVGDPGDAATAELTGEVRRRFMPTAVSVTAPPGTGADLTPLLADRPLVDGRPTAYVCQHFACRRPVTDPSALAAQLDEALRLPRTPGPEAPDGEAAGRGEQQTDAAVVGGGRCCRRRKRAR